MRVLVLTSEASRHMTFATRVLESFDEVAVGIEPKKKYPLRRRTLIRTVRSAIPRIQARLVNTFYSTIFPSVSGRYWAEKKQVEQLYFGESAAGGSDDIAANLLFRVSDSGRINNSEYVNKIKQYEPDVILVMGTSLVSRKVIDSSRVASLNIHTGMSPYYRGSNTNFWPLVQGKPEYCGVTVHGLTTGIDSGGIVVQARPEITPDDTFFSINCKCIRLGIDAVISSVNNLESKPLEFVPQWTRGRLYLGRELNAKWINKYYERVEAGMLPKYVEREQRGEIQHPRIIGTQTGAS